MAESAGEVELQAVSKRFGSFTAVDDLTLSVRAGEFLTLLGPSGCGKTTTLRMIAGFEQPSAGSIMIDGVNAGGLPPFKRNVNTVFQNYALFPHLSVGDNVAFGLKMKRVARAERERRVREALDLVQLRELAGRRPNQLSGGQQQRVALARALVNQPAVLLLDEPLGALDLKLRKAMQLELIGLQQRVGITFIYVTHDQDEALTMSDRVAVMNQGRLLQIGTPTDIYERPSSRFVADFIGESNFLHGIVTDCGPDGARVQVPGVGDVRAVGQAAMGAEVVLAIRPEKIRLDSQNEWHWNSTQGAIVSAIFHGGSTQVITRLGNGQELTVELPNHSLFAPGRLVPGAVVDLVWDPLCTVLLPA